MYQVSIQRDDREGREDREEVEVDKGDLEVQQNPPVAKRTWLQTAAAAGVLAMVREGEALGEEELPSKKKKTPKQLRSQEPKVIPEGRKLTMAEKKLFKEGFLTDKGRLHKRQKKFNKPANFILIMPDNVLGSGAPSSGKYMMFAEGELKESFLQGRLKFDKENYYVHANHFDFKEEKPDLVERNTVKDNKKSRSKTASPKSKEASPKKKRLRKVTTPGCGSSLLDKGFLENNSSAEEEEEEESRKGRRKKSKRSSPIWRPQKVATPGSFLDNGFLDIGTSTDSSSEEEEGEN